MKAKNQKANNKKVTKSKTGKTSKKPATKKVSAKKTVKLVKVVDEKTAKLKKQVRELKKRVKELEELLSETQSELRKYKPHEDDGGEWEWDEKTVTYKDVFDRVCDYLGCVTFDGDENGNVKEDDEIDICIDDDGWEHYTWSNYKEFILGENEESFFDLVEGWNCNYHKLTRWPAAFVDGWPKICNVQVNDKSPAGYMKALDEAGV